MTKNRVGVIGWPIEHSLSPAMHNAAFKALGMDNDWRYDLRAISPDDLPSGVEEMRQMGYVGINVTVPHKHAVMELVSPDEKAQAIGAVNTVDFRDNTGTNTDVDGFIADLQAHGVVVSGEKVLVLGAGGAGRAVVYGLWREGAQITVVEQIPERAQEMIAHLRESVGADGIEMKLLADAAEWDAAVIVNCTPVGMWPKVDVSPWSVEIPFPQGVTVYDLVYRPAKTRLMQQAEDNGGRAFGGLGMLVRQGAAAFTIWTGKDAPFEVMYEVVQTAMDNSEG